MNLTVVILAGGQGSRIGGTKPLKLLGSERLIDRAMRMARQWSQCVAAVVRDAGQVGDVQCRQILDEPGIEGPLAGLAATLRFGKAEGFNCVLTIPADMPFLPSDLGQRLVNEFGGANAAIASSGGHLHPVCGLWRTSALGALPDYLATGRRSLRGFAEAIGFQAVEWPAEPEDPFFNINSLEDLVKAERLLRD